MSNNQREFVHHSHGEKIRVVINPGEEGRIPLLLCSGFGISLEMLDPIVAVMPGTTVIRFDVPGIGRSQSRFLPYRFSHIADVLDDLLTALGFAEADVYGMSWGGMLAQEFALSYPHRCRKLVLASTLAGVVSLPGNPLVHTLLNPRKWLLGSRYSKTASLLYGGRVLREQWLDLEEHLALSHIELCGYLGQLSAVVGWTSIHRLRQLTQPVLLLYGDDDSVIPIINAHVLQKIIPNARLVTLDCGHLFPWTRSDEVYREITKFRSE